MYKDETNSAGICDPYWYEWTVGLQSISKMLSPENGIVSITLQSLRFTGWDDVVVRFEDGHVDYYQVKHTRENDSITFGDLVTKSKEGKSLLSHLVSSWSKMSGGPNDRVIFFTNRPVGARNYTIDKDNVSFVRPPLEKFLDHIKTECGKHKSINQFDIPNKWKDAWEKEWLPCFADIDSDKICRFMSQFCLCTNQPDLKDLEKSVLQSLSSVFGVDDAQAHELFKCLDNALRIWTTTERSREEIMREDVYIVLAKSPTESVGNHFLVPPEPFFNSRDRVCDKVIASIRDRKNKVVFLCGNPGAGKTSIISRLTNRRDRDIDLRYYTFTPISPENDLLPPDSGRTCTSRALWSDLLDQLRKEFKGEWAKLNIPVRSDFLKTVGEIREHVIRLAVELSKRQNRCTVICIDGIDHAARAEVDKGENYLGSLIPPDSIPDGVVFVIGGQPPHSYPLYPDWLKNDHPDVIHVSLPVLEREDIEKLATHKGLENVTHIGEIVLKYTEGNTLSVLYAIETVKSRNSIEDAIQSLESYRLRDGLNTYYNKIWEHCESHCKPHPSLPGKIGAVFALASARIQAADFGEIFPEVGYSESDWELLLQRFLPVLANDPEGYRVRFNDIKVFFTRKVNELPIQTYKSIAWELLVLYKRHERYRKHLHTDLVKLLRKSERLARIFELLTPEFIMESYLCGTLQKDVEEQLYIATELAISERSIDKLHKVNCCTKTFARLYESFDAHTPVETKYYFGTFYQDEFSVINKNEWNTRIIDNLFDEILTLINAGENQRAQGLWQRWLGDLLFDEFIALLPTSEVFEKDPLHQEKQRLACGFTKTLAQLGRISVHLKTSPLITDSIDNANEELTAAVCTGVIEELDTFTDDRVWYREFLRFCSVLPHYHRDIHNLLIRIFRGGKQKRLQLLLRRLSKEAREPRFLNFCLLAAYLGKNKRQINRWRLDRECLITNMNQLSTVDHEGIESTFFYTITGILLGWQERHTDASINVSDLWQAIKGDLHDDRYHLIVLSLIRSAVHVGQWLKEVVHDDVAPDFVFMKESLLKKILTETLDLRSLSKYGFITTKDAERLLLQAITYCLEYANRDWRELFRQTVIERYCKVVYDKNFAFCWKWLQTHGYSKDSNDLLLKLIGKDGAIWYWSASEIEETLQELQKTTEDTPYSMTVEKAWQQSRMHCFHFFSHKEYCMMDEVMWLKDFIRHKPTEWKSKGLEVLALSERIKEVGDNRPHYEVETLLMLSALKAGPQDAFLAYIQFESSRELLPRTINEHLKDITTTSLELITLWIICCGFASRYHRADFENLPSLSEVIREIDKEGKIQQFMRKRTPYESNLKTRDYGSSKQHLIKDPELAGSLEEQLEFVLREYPENGRLLRKIVHEIGQQHHESSSHLISRILVHLLSSNGYSTWEWAGLGQVHQELFPLLSDEQKWRVAENLQTRLAAGGKRRSPHLVADAIEQFCSYYCAEDITQVTDGLDRLINMHSGWLTGFGAVAQGQPRNISMATSNKLVSSWEEFSIEVLIHRLDSHSCIRIEGALRSLYLLITEKPILLNYVNNTWHDRSPDQQEYLLMILEPVFLYNPSQFNSISLILQKAYSQPNFTLKLQGFLVFYAAARVLGIPAPVPEMQPNEQLLSLGEIDLVRRDGIRIEDKSIFIRNTEEHFCRRKSFLDTIPGVETRGLKEKALYLLETGQNKSENEHDEIESDVIDGDLKLTSRRENDMFNAVVEHQVAVGVIGAPLPALAQSLLTNDDPNILLAEEYLHDGDWPDLYSKNQNSAEEDSFSRLINYNLNDEYEVVASYAQFPKGEMIYFYETNTYVLASASIISKPPSAITFNGRSSFVYDRRTYQAIDLSQPMYPLFVKSGGISRLQNFTSKFIPSIPVLKRLGLDLDPCNPFKITKDKREVGRLQILVGSNEETGRRCSQLRLVQRWVINRKTLRVIKELLAGSVLKATKSTGKRHVNLYAE